MLPKISLGFSFCPNDTYIFHALASGIVAFPSSELEVVMADVEELNEMAEHGKLDVTKVSIAAVSGLLDEYVLLPSGGALGRGVGPVLVTSGIENISGLDGATVALPGEKTTANLLFSMYCKEQGIRPKSRQMVYDEVMPAIESGEVDAGVLIHEGRFTFAAHGLSRLLDLGQWWEDFTNMPIPLGGILVRRSLGEDVVRAIAVAVRKSLQHAIDNPELSKDYIKKHAQEMDDQVIAKHINTFVTDASLDMGAEGEGAVVALIEEACRVQGRPMTDKPVFIRP